jgi:hypothetical protein
VARQWAIEQRGQAEAQTRLKRPPLIPEEGGGGAGRRPSASRAGQRKARRGEGEAPTVPGLGLEHYPGLRLLVRLQQRLARGQGRRVGLRVARLNPRLHQLLQQPHAARGLAAGLPVQQDLPHALHLRPMGG